MIEKTVLAEGTELRMLSMPCCSHALSWLGTRLPNFCPECGRPVLEELRSGVYTSNKWSVDIVEVPR
jgi:hypothetical protein